MRIFAVSGSFPSAAAAAAAPPNPTPLAWCKGAGKYISVS